MQTIILSVVILGALGGIFGLLLAVASNVFRIETDPREETILGSLPGVNCGGCGYPGCAGYAAAVVKGEAPTTSCRPGGKKVAERLAEIMSE